ncbi:hypothetical protein EPYR_00876 [Erwinia pyrifoliae DSM 12163]|nr:hypothetical protein EPYR_00876 [Erwinia pyrifoliae DSM 12163]
MVKNLDSGKSYAVLLPALLNKQLRNKFKISIFAFSTAVQAEIIDFYSKNGTLTDAVLFSSKFYFCWPMGL